MRDDDAGPDPDAMRRRLLRYRVGAIAALLAGAAGTVYLAAAQDRCSGGGSGAGGLVVHDARGQPRLAIGLVGRCQPRPP
ncbi:hypothetical protein H0E84_17365 [Luteimonas sp. SJ-92]|uniref:Uncharacterized protein n=1 Tax=Luteimonas salinisoli TaxID=2752307 RepID=A0A853JFK8_9GAMM|nr:hypothetical protein [Luteimonas salinisoli]NZA28151.1 hypothetical protein [Luteimonas salinisoli]